MPVALPPGRLRLATRPAPDRVDGGYEHDRNGGGGGLRRQRAGRCAADDHRHRPADQIVGQSRKPLGLVVRPAIFDRNVLTFDKACFAQASPQSGHEVLGARGGATANEPDHGHCRLLRARREGPRGRSARKCDELAASHSITSSAVASKLDATSRPSIRAARALITNLLDCTTGRSAGFAPLRMRPA